MSIAATGKLLALINRDNPKATLNTGNVQLTEAAVNTNSEIIRDTMVTLSGIVNSNRKGSVTVYYNRIDLPVLFKNITTSLRFEALADTVYHTTDLVAKLNAKYGTDFTEDDFVSSVIDLSTLPTQVTLTVQDGNHAYSGSVTLTVAEGASELSTVVLSTDLDGLNYESTDVTKGQAAVYSYNFDGSNDVNSYDWASVTTASITTPVFIEAFNRIDGVDDDWVTDGVTETPYNLYGSVVAYNGNNVATDIATSLNEEILLNPLYNKVLVFKLGALCSNFAGYVTVYYGGLKA